LSRWGDQREVSAGHEQRAKEAQAEVVKGNQIIEKLSVGAKGAHTSCTCGACAWSSSLMGSNNAAGRA